MRGSRLTGLGHYLPERVVTNAELSERMETNDEWIQKRTGIRERRWVEGNVGPTDLAVHAAKQALDAAQIQATDLDMIIFATLSPDINFPGSSCLLQQKLDCPGIATLDVRNQCTGFVYGLAIADQFIRSGSMSNILVVGAEVHSSGLDISSRGRDLAVLFGDGAGAAVVSATEGESRILDSRLHADGRFHEILMLEAPASRSNPRLTEAMLAEGLHFPRMQGRAVFKHAVERIPEVVGEILQANGMTLEDVDLVVPHQANLRINELVCRRLGLPPEKMVHNIQHYGNTTAASIPIALHEAELAGRMQPGSLVLLAAFGAGLTWGSNLIRW
jgi:3-oxoacyl-[acyl-carrier-protein] synthase-3